MNRRRSASILVAVAAISLAACGDDDSAASATNPTTAQPAATTPPATQPPAATAMAENIVGLAASNPDFSVLVEAVKAAGLVDTLSGTGPFTVFAPTNAAFDTALAALKLTKAELLADKELLTKVLTYHVVAGKVMAADVAALSGQDVATVNGATLKVMVDGSTVKLNDATVTATDLDASNGVIHVIDTVLVPPAG